MNIEFKCAKELVVKFVENPNFAREIKLAKDLLYNYSPDLDSWLSLSLPFKINSLAFFKTDAGKVFIPQSQKNPYLLDFDKLAPKSKHLDFSVN